MLWIHYIISHNQSFIGLNFPVFWDHTVGHFGLLNITTLLGIGPIATGPHVLWFEFRPPAPTEQFRGWIWIYVNFLRVKKRSKNKIYGSEKHTINTIRLQGNVYLDPCSFLFPIQLTVHLLLSPVEIYRGKYQRGKRLEFRTANPLHNLGWRPRPPIAAN